MMTRTRIIKRSTQVKFTHFHCTPAEFFLSCCGSVAAPRQRLGRHDQVPAKSKERCRGHRPRHHDQVPAALNGRRRGQRPGHHAQLPARSRGQRPGATIKYLRRTTSSTIFRKASCSATEEGDYEYFSSYLWLFRTRMPVLHRVARIYCDEQHFYWAARFVFETSAGTSDHE